MTEELIGIDGARDKFDGVPRRLGSAWIEEKIVSEAYHHFPNSTAVVCLLTLVNGYHIVGSAVAADAGGLDIERGKQFARRAAIDQVRPLEAYVKKENFFRRQRRRDAEAPSAAAVTAELLRDQDGDLP